MQRALPKTHIYVGLQGQLHIFGGEFGVTWVAGQGCFKVRQWLLESIDNLCFWQNVWPNTIWIHDLRYCTNNSICATHTHETLMHTRCCLGPNTYTNMSLPPPYPMLVSVETPTTNCSCLECAALSRKKYIYIYIYCRWT